MQQGFSTCKKDGHLGFTASKAKRYIIFIIQRVKSFSELGMFFAFLFR